MKEAVNNRSTTSEISRRGFLRLDRSERQPSQTRADQAIETPERLSDQSNMTRRQFGLLMGAIAVSGKVLGVVDKCDADTRMPVYVNLESSLYKLKNERLELKSKLYHLKKAYGESDKRLRPLQEKMEVYDKQIADLEWEILLLLRQRGEHSGKAVDASQKRLKHLENAKEAERRANELNAENNELENLMKGW